MKVFIGLAILLIVFVLMGIADAVSMMVGMLRDINSKMGGIWEEINKIRRGQK